MKRVLRALLAFCVAATGEAAAADLTIVSTTTTGGRSATVTEYLTEARARTSDGASEAIVDAARDRVVVVDHARREYWETSRAGAAAARAGAPASPAAEAGQAKSLGLLDVRGASLEAVTREKGKQPREVAGHPCEHWVIAMGESLRVDLWAARDLAAPPAYFDALQARHAGMGPLGRRLDRVVDEMRKVGGLPLARRTTVRVMGAEQETRQEATVVSLGPVPPSAFEVPEGYARRGTPLAP